MGLRNGEKTTKAGEICLHVIDWASSWFFNFVYLLIKSLFGKLLYTVLFVTLL